MHRPFPFVVILLIALLVLIWGSAAVMAPYSAGGWWGMGPGMMAGPGLWRGYGPAMMRGCGPGFASPGWSTAEPGHDLSVDDVKTYVDRWIAWQGNPHLKTGDVKEKDADTIVADIVTKDGSLVQRFAVDRRSGYFRPSED